MNNDFIITPREDKTIIMTIRVDKSIQQRFDELSKQSNRSRNELINMALEYALQNVKFAEGGEKNNSSTQKSSNT